MLRKCLIGLTAAVGLVAVQLALPGAASADPANCSSWPNPVNATSTYTVASVSFSRARAELRFGNINGRQAGWARLAGAFNNGDQYWLDVSSTRGNGWIQCGPFTYTGDGGGDPRNFTPAHYTSSDPNLVFRACGKTAGSSASWCTGWQ